MVTVELAVGMVTATLLTVTLAGVVLLGVAQAACARTSSEIARQLSRGDDRAAGVAEDGAPAGSLVDVRELPDGVDVRVSTPVEILGVGPFTVSARRWAVWEPGARDATPG